MEILAEAAQAAPAPTPSAEGDLVGRGRQKGVPGTIAKEGTVHLKGFCLCLSCVYVK